MHASGNERAVATQADGKIEKRRGRQNASPRSGSAAENLDGRLPDMVAHRREYGANPFTRPVVAPCRCAFVRQEPQALRLGGHVSFGEVPRGVTPPVRTWYPIGVSVGQGAGGIGWPFFFCLTSFGFFGIFELSTSVPAFFPARRPEGKMLKKVWRGSRAAVGVLTAVLGATDASADTSRITVVFRPAATTSPFAVEIANGARRRGVALPSLTLTGGPSGLRVGGYTTQLPTIKLRGLSLAPRYGDQQFRFDFQPAALAGMAPDSRAVRGLAITLAGRGVSGALLAGRPASDTASLLGSAVPSVLAFSATLKPASTLAISPRLATALARPSLGNRTESTLGLGLRAELSPHVSIVGDAGGTRTKSGRWAQLGAVGALGRWSRVSFEASASRADNGVTLLGAVPFAALDRKVASARLLLLRGISVEGQLTASRPIDGPTKRDVTVARSAGFRIDRFHAGSLLLGLNGNTTGGRRAHDVTVEWRFKSSSGASIQFRQQRDGVSAPHIRRLQIEVPAIPTGTARLNLSLQSSMFLSSVASAQPRITTRIKGRVAATGRLGLMAEGDLNAAVAHSIVRVTRLATGADISILRGMSIQVTHAYRPGEPVRAWRQIELRVARTLAL